MAAFNYLIRFSDDSGQTRYGEADGPISAESELLGRSVKVYTGEPGDQNFRLSNEQATVSTVLCPVNSTPIIYGVGLNYKAHAAEGNLKLPPYPMIFTKPPDALAGPYENIPVSREGWQLDYEGELCIIMGKDCKDLSSDEDPLSYVLGYTIGNDLSSRYWQDKVRASGQHGYGKSMDKFAPLGPVLVSNRVIQDPSGLNVLTHVNGEQRQASSTANMIFDCSSLIRHLSRGRTLRKGTVIMTGTPDGVAAFMQPSPWLQDGDVVEIEFSGIGRIKNRMAFEDKDSAPEDKRPPGF